MSGMFITFEGNEGSGKTTQIALLVGRLRSLGRSVLSLREPGGTPIGEEIRHTLKHSNQNSAMTPEAELLLMNASRAQLVREVIRPALAVGKVVLCDRFYDSTVAYQGYGRGLDMRDVKAVIDFAVGPIRPQLTFLLWIPQDVSEARRRSRQSGAPPAKDRFEDENRDFFLRVENGYREIAAAEPARVRQIDATASIEEVHRSIWNCVEEGVLTKA
jgi:dTMP kinase